MSFGGNGSKLGGNGEIGINKASEKPAYLPRVYEFAPQNGIIEIFIKTSNYHYQWGGILVCPQNYRCEWCAFNS